MHRLLPLLFLSCVSTDPFDEVECTRESELKIVVLGADGLPAPESPLPFRNGGEIDVAVQVDVCGFLGDAMGHAYLVGERVEASSGDDGAATVAFGERFPLARVVDANGVPALEGRTTLVAGRGGPVRIGAEALGLMNLQTLNVVQPTLGRSVPPTLEPAASGVRVSLCLETSVALGELEVEQRDVDTPTKFKVATRRGSCVDPMAADAFHFRFALNTTKTDVSYRASIAKTEVDLEETLPALVNRTVSLSFPELESGLLPPAGELVRARVIVAEAGNPSAAQPVVLAGVTAMPSMLITNIRGEVDAFFAAPAVDELTVLATSGPGVSEAVLLRRANAGVRFVFPTGSPEAMGVLRPAGERLDVTIGVTRAGIPAEGELPTLVASAATTIAALSRTDADGIATASVIAPDANLLTLTAALGTASDVVVLRRASVPDPTLTISFDPTSPASIGTLPPADSILTVLVNASRDGRSAAGETVSFSAIPTVSTTPSGDVRTDRTGQARFHLQVPTVGSLLLRVASGAEVAEVALRR